jgi:hypothetical protein
VKKPSYKIKSNRNGKKVKQRAAKLRGKLRQKT